MKNALEIVDQMATAADAEADIINPKFVIVLIDAPQTWSASRNATRAEIVAACRATADALESRSSREYGEEPRS